MGFHAFRDLYRFLRLQLGRHSLDSSCLFCNDGLLFPDLLALRIVRFAKEVHVEGETLHLRCNGAYPFCKETQLFFFFFTGDVLLVIDFKKQRVQTKKGDVYQGQRCDLPRLSPDHAQMPQ